MITKTKVENLDRCTVYTVFDDNYPDELLGYTFAIPHGYCPEASYNFNEFYLKVRKHNEKLEMLQYKLRFIEKLLKKDCVWISMTTVGQCDDILKSLEQDVKQQLKELKGSK